jgi:hypothetical protein
MDIEVTVCFLTGRAVRFRDRDVSFEALSRLFPAELLGRVGRCPTFGNS